MHALGMFSRLTAALADDEPERALERVMAELERWGIVRLEPGSPLEGQTWLQVELGERRLAFAAHGQPPEDEVREILGTVLSCALRRAVEHDARKRMSERLEMLSAASFEGIFVHSDGVVIDANQRLAELSGYEHADLLGGGALEKCVVPEDLPAVRERVASRYEGAYVVTALRKDGTRFLVELQSKQGRLGDRPVRVVAVRDVTERERTLALLHESEARLRDLAEEAFDLTVLSRDGVIVDVDARVERLLGVKREQVIGHPLFEWIAPASQALARQVIADGLVGSYEVVLVAASGEPIPMEVIGVHSSLHGEPVRVAGLRDLRDARRQEDERRKLEQQLVRTQRLESLGVLAGGIAHDFNNLLVGVLGNAEFLMARLSDGVDRRSAQEIHAAGERAADLIKQMLAYAGQRDVARREPVDLGKLIQELHQLLGATLSKKARVRSSLAPGSVVLGDRATLTQVLMNLLTNASDALDGGAGAIELRTELVGEPDARWDDALGARVRPGAWVLLEVRDDGAGMDEQTRGRVFEPFFTTKERGHGLGLAACLGIVAAHGGAIRVESEPGKGSCFSVMLPAAELESSSSPRAASGPRAKPCRVLVVDDEALVRSQVRRSLELRGFTVEEANGGRSALARFEQQGADVILLDMTMHDLAGLEVVAAIRASGSRVPIVLASGYFKESTERGLGSADVQGFLRKPYRISELIEAIERAFEDGNTP